MKSLQSRLVLSVVAIVVFITLVIGVTTTLALRQWQLDRLDADVRSSQGRVVAALRLGPAGPGSPEDIRRLSVGTLIVRFADQSSSGVILTDGRQDTLSPSTLDELGDVAVGAVRTERIAGHGRYRVLATAVDGTTLLVGLPTDPVDDTVRTMVVWELLLLLVGVALAALAGNAFVRRQLAPLRSVAATAHAVTTTPLDRGEVTPTVRVPEELTDPATEVGQVGEALNNLLDHVDAALSARHESEQRVRQFLADASHELRTPLTTLRGYAELGRRTGTDQLAKVEQEAARMGSLVEDLLLLARLDSGRPQAVGDVDLAELVSEAVDDARVVHPDHTWTAVLPDDPVIVSGDATQLHQAVTNLLMNAARHTPEGTSVAARVALDGDRVRVSVHDDGPGLDPALAATVFDRFTRGDSSRTRASGGAGLGTSMVKAIAQAHGGDATVASTPGDTTFSFTVRQDFA